MPNNEQICPKGGAHEWGTDGQHSNVFCKKCFMNVAKIALTLDEKRLVEEMAKEIHKETSWFIWDGSGKEKQERSRDVAQSLLPLIAVRVEQARKEERERVVDEFASIVRQVGQDVDENGKGTDNPKDKVLTIWFIGAGRLDDAVKALKEGK